MGPRRHRISAAILALAFAAVPVAGCGEEDVDQGVDKATDGVSEAGREVKDEGGEIKRDAEKELND